MNERRTLALVLGTALVGQWFLLWPILRNSGPIDLWPTLMFGAAYLLLELFEIELPRGDSSTMSSPVVANAAIALSPLGAIVAVGVPGLVAELLARRSGGREREIHDLMRRLVVLTSGILVASWVGTPTSGGVTLSGAFFVAAIVVAVDFLVAQLQTAVRLGAGFWRQVLGSSQMEGTMLLAKATASLVAAIVHPAMGVWAVAALVLLLLVMRQAFSSFVSVRRAYQSTIEALARTVEAQDPEKSGHAQRVSDLAAEVGRQLNLRGADLERVAYASLLHDLGEVGQESSEHGASNARFTSADMIANVSFLADVVPILRLCEGDGPESEEDLQSREDAWIAYVVMAASRTDDFAQGRSVDHDSRALKWLGSRLSADELMRTERAFRAAAGRVEGTLFAFGQSGRRD